MTSPPRVAGAGADHGDESALFQLCKPMLSGTRRKSDVLRDCGSGAALPLGDVIQDTLFGGINGGGTDRLRPQGDAEAKSYFCELGFRKPGTRARSYHSLYARPPLFNQSQLIEDPRKDTIAHTGKSLAQFFDCEARQQDARVLNLYAVVKYGHSNGGTALGIVSMHNGVHQCFAQGCGRDGGDVASP
jgi:hypothetical protein